MSGIILLYSVPVFIGALFTSFALFLLQIHSKASLLLLALYLGSAFAITISFSEGIQQLWRIAHGIVPELAGFALLGSSIVMIATIPRERIRATNYPLLIHIAVYLVIYLFIASSIGAAEADFSVAHTLWTPPVGFLLYSAFGRNYNALAITLCGTFIVSFDEILRLYLPERVFDPIDIFFNVIGFLLGLFIAASRLPLHHSKTQDQPNQTDAA